MIKSVVFFLLINLIVIANCLGQTIKLQGKWLAELNSGNILLLDLKNNDSLTLGYIDNSFGPLQLETEHGKWKFESGTLKLSFQNEIQELKVESIYLDSVVFKKENSNTIQFKKLVHINNADQSIFLNIKKKLIGKRMFDSNGNTYHFFNKKQFIYNKSENCKLQEKYWYIFDFEGMKFLILGDGEWFATRISFIPYNISDNGISFKYYYKNNIADFELSNFKPGE